MLHIPKALYKDISILQKKQNKTDTLPSVNS